MTPICMHYIKHLSLFYIKYAVQVEERSGPEVYLASLLFHKHSLYVQLFFRRT